MKRIALILTIIFSSFFSISQNEKIENKIYPIDESRNDPEISQFIDSLNQILMSKDTFRLYNLLHEKVVTSFGGAIYGKKGFIENWNLNYPENSMVWDLMKRVIDLGGVYGVGGIFEETKNNITFSFPYANSSKQFTSIYEQNPDYDFDPHFTIICLDKNVPLYKDPDNNSEIIAYLEYDILKMDYEKTNEEISNKLSDSWNWIYASKIDNSVTGWIKNGKDFYFLGGLTLIIEKVDSKYIITGFFPYD